MTTQSIEHREGARGLTDDELVRAFEAARLPAGGFHHADHVRLAWILLRRMPLLEAIGRMRDGLRGFAESVGRPEKYHETVTWASLVIVHQRMWGSGACASWRDFAAANPDLLRWTDGPFFELYGADVLTSPEAREIFVLPGSPTARRQGTP